jgi:MFS family permease
MSHIPTSPAQPSLQTSDNPEKNYRHNYTFNLFNAIFYFFGESLVDTRVVMTAFLSQLTTSNTLIAFLAPMRLTGWFLPQFFAAPFIERYRVKIVFYRQNAFLRMVAWVVLIIGMFFIQNSSVMLGLFFACILFIALSDGLSGLPWMIVTSKTIPADRRGMLFAMRNGVGSVVGILGGFVVVYLLAGNFLSFPQNYAILFALATLFFALSYWSFGRTIEPADDNAVPNASIPNQLRRAGDIIRQNVEYRRFLIARMCLTAGIAAIPFITVFARRELNISDAFLGAMVSVTIGANLIANYVLGRLSAQFGNRLNVILAGIFGALMCLTGVLVVTVPIFATPLIPVFFILSGITNTAIQISGGPMVMDLAPAEERSAWFGLTNTLLGLTMIATGIAGIIIDYFGYATMFALCGVAFIVSIQRTLKINKTEATHE